jgi:biopolymer transport protein ExbB
MTHYTHLLTLAQDGNDSGRSLWEIIQSGGMIGYIIIALSIAAVALIITHIAQIRRKALLPPRHLAALNDMLSNGDATGAVEYCLDPSNDSYLTRILATGLTRYQKSAFGAFEIKNAIEEAGEDQTARLYRSTDALGVIGHIAPLLGLLGTVVGMVGAFEALGQTAGSNHEQLASQISLALVTTLMGLVLAIPVIALYTFFRNRIDAFASEAALEIEQLVLHLESTVPGVGTGPAGSAPGGAAAGGRPASGARPAGAAAATGGSGGDERSARRSPQ